MSPEFITVQDVYERDVLLRTVDIKRVEDSHRDANAMDAEFSIIYFEDPENSYMRSASTFTVVRNRMMGVQ